MSEDAERDEEEGKKQQEQKKDDDPWDNDLLNNRKRDKIWAKHEPMVWGKEDHRGKRGREGRGFSLHEISSAKNEEQVTAQDIHKIRNAGLPVDLLRQSKHDGNVELLKEVLPSVGV